MRPGTGLKTMEETLGAQSELTVGAYTFRYNHPHDILGIIETAVLDVYRCHRIREGSTVLDIGAGIGDFTVMDSRACGVSGTVVAIEPDTEDFGCLVTNLELNHCKNVIPINAAVSDFGKILALSFKGRTTFARSRRLRDLLRGAGIQPQSVSFAKIDIEGGERVVVPDNLDILSHCDRVAIELHDGVEQVLHPLMRRAGFIFQRVRRRDILSAALAFSFRHPFQARQAYYVAKSARILPGPLKVTRGIEIVRSSNLVVGTYVRPKGIRWTASSPAGPSSWGGTSDPLPLEGTFP